VRCTGGPRTAAVLPVLSTDCHGRQWHGLLRLSTSGNCHVCLQCQLPRLYFCSLSCRDRVINNTIRMYMAGGFSRDPNRICSLQDRIVDRSLLALATRRTTVDAILDSRIRVPPLLTLLCGKLVERPTLLAILCHNKAKLCRLFSLCNVMGVDRTNWLIAPVSMVLCTTCVNSTVSHVNRSN
jgi:hypothetical protein